VISQTAVRAGCHRSAPEKRAESGETLQEILELKVAVISYGREIAAAADGSERQGEQRDARRSFTTTARKCRHAIDGRTLEDILLHLSPPAQFNPPSHP